MPPFPLPERIELDRTQLQNYFLSNAVYGEDFVATRDKGTEKGSIWSFKRCNDWEVFPDLPYRLPSPPFFVNVFGQVDIACLVGGGKVVIRLKSPSNSVCKIRHSYDRQLAQLKRILWEDGFSAVSACRSPLEPFVF
ncbi:hypothetical protein B0H16DRAFT_1722592 [Mycena metata]|uniref:Uncharacterized protein n=1 Tax=Mycena metata TaxID=1033252 RepID=A0AAD7NCU4_9AGAR|nr:hypothetical protein B0H16DRAFT_1722592 [Mycena metata]